MAYDKYIRIEIIFDHDHGSKHYGWFTRQTETDGSQEDIPIQKHWCYNVGVSEEIIRAWALVFYAHSGMTTLEIEHLNDTIEVKR